MEIKYHKITDREKRALKQVVDEYLQIEYDVCDAMLKTSDKDCPGPENFADGTHSYYAFKSIEGLLKRIENE